MPLHAATPALAAAALFGASTPLAKWLVGEVLPLLLNLEAVLKALMAWWVFHESASRRIVAGFAAIVTGGVLLAWERGPHACRRARC